MDTGAMRLTKLLLIGAIMLAAPGLRGQATFEAASVKMGVPIPRAPGGYILKPGGIGSRDPGQFTATAIPLLRLILWSYDRIPPQVASSRSLEVDQYDIVAKVPFGATVAQVKVMVQNLLAERIGLVVHHETRRAPVYEMVIAKGGLKMKPAEPAPPEIVESTPAATAGVSLSKDDSVVLAPGQHTWILESIDASTMRLAGRMIDLAELIHIMERQAGRPVIDKTGLGGRYDFDFTFTPVARPAADAPATTVASDPGGDFLVAVRSQLGLKLLPGKGPVDVLVVDKWDKVAAGY